MLKRNRNIQSQQNQPQNKEPKFKRIKLEQKQQLKKLYQQVKKQNEKFEEELLEKNKYIFNNVLNKDNFQVLKKNCPILQKTSISLLSLFDAKKLDFDNLWITYKMKPPLQQAIQIQINPSNMYRGFIYDFLYKAQKWQFFNNNDETIKVLTIILISFFKNPLFILNEMYEEINENYETFYKGTIGILYLAFLQILSIKLINYFNSVLKSNKNESLKLLLDLKYFIDELTDSFNFIITRYQKNIDKIGRTEKKREKLKNMFIKILNNHLLIWKKDINILNEFVKKELETYNSINQSQQFNQSQKQWIRKLNRTSMEDIHLLAKEFVNKRYLEIEKLNNLKEDSFNFKEIKENTNLHNQKTENIIKFIGKKITLKENIFKFDNIDKNIFNDLKSNKRLYEYLTDEFLYTNFFHDQMRPYFIELFFQFCNSPFSFLPNNIKDVNYSNIIPYTQFFRCIFVNIVGNQIIDFLYFKNELRRQMNESKIFYNDKDKFISSIKLYFYEIFKILEEINLYVQKFESFINQLDDFNKEIDNAYYAVNLNSFDRETKLLKDFVTNEINFYDHLSKKILQKEFFQNQQIKKFLQKTKEQQHQNIPKINETDKLKGDLIELIKKDKDAAIWYFKLFILPMIDPSIREKMINNYHKMSILSEDEVKDLTMKTQKSKITKQQIKKQFQQEQQKIIQKLQQNPQMKNYQQIIQNSILPKQITRKIINDYRNQFE